MSDYLQRLVMRHFGGGADVARPDLSAAAGLAEATPSPEEPAPSREILQRKANLAGALVPSVADRTGAAGAPSDGPRATASSMSSASAPDNGNASDAFSATVTIPPSRITARPENRAASADATPPTRWPESVTSGAVREDGRSPLLPMGGTKTRALRARSEGPEGIGETAVEPPQDFTGRRSPATSTVSEIAAGPVPDTDSFRQSGARPTRRERAASGIFAEAKSEAPPTLVSEPLAEDGSKETGVPVQPVTVADRSVSQADAHQQPSSPATVAGATGLAESPRGSPISAEADFSVSSFADVPPTDASHALFSVTPDFTPANPSVVRGGPELRELPIRPVRTGDAATRRERATPGVTVSIGTIEVRVTAPPPPAPAAAPTRFVPRLTLDEYLRRRNGSAT